MARRSAIVIAATVLTVLLVPAIPAAAGGGGCHSGATQGTGDTVELVDACPTPTILTIDPGGTVSFVNQDPFAHNVIGSSWGHPEDLNQGDGFTATFDEPGVYPWACWYHPGMTGAIVVGDGTGVGNGAAVTVSSFSQPEPSPVVQVRTVTGQASAAPVVAGWVIGPLLGIGIGLGIAALIRRRPRPAA
jgi:plastocyanin